MAWVFVAREADCLWEPPNFADDLFFFFASNVCLLLDILPGAPEK